MAAPERAAASAHHGELMRRIRARHLRWRPWVKVCVVSRTRARDDGCHARRHAPTVTRCIARRCGRVGAGVARIVRADAGRIAVREDPQCGAELRGRAPEALALRLVQREPGGDHAGRALRHILVRRHPGRHPARGHRGATGGQAGAPGTVKEAPGGSPSVAGQPAAHRAITTNSNRRTAPVARRSNASAKRSANSSTASRPSSSCCVISAASTPAPAASGSRPCRCPHR